MTKPALPGSLQVGNLPAEVTRFVGRRQELVNVKRALERSRLVTLCGVGGVGKTRLALRTATDLQRSFPDGTWLAELSALREPALLARSVAAALRLPDQSAGDPVDLLADHLATRHQLLVLDTCEHLADACALLAEVLLRAAPRLWILATSREPLDVMGEHTVLVAPLTVPGPGEVPDGVQETECDSVALFADRAEAIVAGFSVNAGNRAAVARLCHRLDGIPLAIELAAVRLRALSVEQITERLDNRFRLLGTSRGSLNRHQTLRAAVEWSHDLCTPEERLLWARLSAFPGDFDLTAAEHVCAGGPLRAPDLLDNLGRLIEKSIVVCERDGHRYRMLDTIREFGAEQLAELGEQEELRTLHRDYFLRLAEQAAAAQLSGDHAGWLERLGREPANLRVALDHSLTTPGQQAAGLRMVRALIQHWLSLGLIGEARGWLRRTLALDTEPSPDRGRAAVAAAVTAVQQGAVAEAEAPLAEAERIAAGLGDQDLRAHAVQVRGLMALYTGDLAEAGRLMEEAREVFGEIGYRDPYALVLFAQLAGVRCLTGELDQALALCEEGMRASDATGEQWSRSFVLWVRASVRWMMRDPGGAQEDALTCLAIKESFNDLLGVALSLDLLAVCALDRGEPEQAAELLGATQVMWQTLGAPIQQGPHYAELRDATVTSVQKRLGEQRFAAAGRRGSGLSVAAAIALARGETTPAAETGAAPANPLTKREREIAGLVAEGLSNREIAERLVIAKRTADSHIEHILAKLGYASRAQIAAWSERLSGS